MSDDLTSGVSVFEVGDIVSNETDQSAQVSPASFAVNTPTGDGTRNQPPQDDAA